jgi:ABC-2 type transport system ATP-binding protein
MPYLLEAKNLNKSFGNSQVVHNLSLKIESGECLAILGPNGAGKTTTFEMLEGLIQPDSGSINILGESWDTGREKILPRIGVHLQETSLYKRFTVRETLVLFASFYQNAIPLVDLLKLVGLQDKVDVELRKLSGGQKQRVFIAAAIINNPELIFLDEPTTGLDPAARRDIWDIIKSLKAKGVGILLSTHHMEEAEALATRVVILNEGKIIAEGPTEDLIKLYIGEDMITTRKGTLEDVFLTLTGRGLQDE